MQKGFKFQRMGERGRILGQIPLCSNTCNTGQMNWILSALFHCIRKSILITVVIIPTFSPQYFVRIYSLTLQVVLNAKKCYGEETLHCRLGGQIYIYRLLQLRHFINVPKIYAPLCMYVHMCVCVYIYIYIYGKLRDSWEEINITVHFILQQNMHMKSEHFKTISVRNTVLKSYVV